MADGSHSASSSTSSADELAAVCVDCAAVVPFTAHRAATEGHLDCLQAAVGRGASLVSRTGDTLLHVAAQAGRLDCLRWCLKEVHRIDLSSENAKGNLPLHLAIDGGNLDCVKAIFAAVNGREADLISDAIRNMMGKTNRSGLSPLIMATIHRQEHIVEWLIEIFGKQLPGLINDSCGATVYHYATAAGCLPIIQKLHRVFPSLANQAIPSTGVWPIYLAAQCGTIECLEFLTSETENKLTAVTRDKMTCAHIAVQSGQLTCLKWIVERLSRTKPKDEVLLEGDKEMATVFHFAAAFGQTKCMQYLLQEISNQRAAVSALDIWHRTPLHDAAEKNHGNSFKLLLAAGADLFAKDQGGVTPFDLAIKSEKLKRHIQASPKARAKTSDSPHLSPQMGRKASARYTGQNKTGFSLPKAEAHPEYLRAVSLVVSEDTSTSVTPSSSEHASLSSKGGDPVYAEIDKSKLLPRNAEAQSSNALLAVTVPTLQKCASVEEGMERAGLTAPEPGMQRSASFDDVSIPHTREVDAQQPRVKIIHAKGSPSRVNTEVNKLVFALKMFHVPVQVLTLTKDILSHCKNPAALLEWLKTTTADTDLTLFICTEQLRDLFSSPGRVDKKSSSGNDFSLPVNLRPRIFAVVTTGGASSRYRPPWLHSAQCFYWPKNQPILFSKMGITLPEHTLAPPTRQKRSHSK